MSELITVINTAIASTVEAVVDVLTTNLPLVLGVFGALVALGIIIRLVKRYIGRRA